MTVVASFFVGWAYLLSLTFSIQVGRGPQLQAVKHQCVKARTPWAGTAWLCSMACSALFWQCWSGACHLCSTQPPQPLGTAGPRQHIFSRFRDSRRLCLRPGAQANPPPACACCRARSQLHSSGGWNPVPLRLVRQLLACEPAACPAVRGALEHQSLRCACLARRWCGMPLRRAAAAASPASRS